ncbi:MAG: hypothetical protein KDJ73_04960 [Notoacmeibacter sp.]|nr:hypothetical protein [Notoacmeibacter sp.]MCC0033359.1 hypothetical protein [Brucellaceae bacterium]
MDGIETAIRNALAKGDAADPAYRERVYLSALSALERSIKANPALTADIAAKRRAALRERIRSIETEFQPASEPEGTAREPAETEPVVYADAAPVVRPDVFAPAAEPQAGVSGSREEDFVSELRATRSEETDMNAPLVPPDEPVLSRKKRPFAWMLSIAVIVAFVVIGLWWLVSSGALLPLSERDGAVPNPPAQLQSDDFRPATLGEKADATAPQQGGTWITIFDPADPTTVTAPSGTAADVTGNGAEKAIRIKPTAIDSAALFDVGQGVLEQVAGKRVTFEINASAPEGRTTQMSIQCNLAELGDCGRKRYDVEPARNNFLFEIELPEKPAGSFGSIALTPDISEGKAAVDIYSIRVFVPDGS